MEDLYEKGRHDEKIETIKRMGLLNSYLDVDDAAIIVGLPKKEFLELRDELEPEMERLHWTKNFNIKWADEEGDYDMKRRALYNLRCELKIPYEELEKDLHTDKLQLVKLYLAKGYSKLVEGILEGKSDEELMNQNHFVEKGEIEVVKEYIKSFAQNN